MLNQGDEAGNFVPFESMTELQLIQLEHYLPITFVGSLRIARYKHMWEKNGGRQEIFHAFSKMFKANQNCTYDFSSLLEQVTWKRREG